MADRIPGPCNSNLRDSVCIDVNRVYDCCKDRDCITDMRLYIPDNCQSLVDRAINVKPDSAELIWAYIDVEELAFNKGFYTVDVKFFFKCSVDVFTAAEFGAEAADIRKRCSIRCSLNPFSGSCRRKAPAATCSIWHGCVTNCSSHR